MDPCPFVRLIVESLSLKLPTPPRPANAGVHPTATPCFCTINLLDTHIPTQTSPLPLSSDPTNNTLPPISFSIDPTTLHRLSAKPTSTLSISVHAGRSAGVCGFNTGRLLGKVKVPVELEAPSARPAVLRSGWVVVGRARLHLVVRCEPDPRFVFQFGGEPECSPVVFQVQGGAGCAGRSGCLRQPVFSCRFSADRRRSTRSRSLPSDSATSWKMKGWLGSLGGERGHHQRNRDQRKGWTVTIHDLSGSPVAAASMVTPFVPSPGSSERVSRSNPGAWLILQPAALSPSTNWKPWGRLEAWRDRGPVDSLGYRFELVSDAATAHSHCHNGGGVLIAESSISVRKGGEFCIDPSAVAGELSAPFGGGFVMGSTVDGEGKVSLPEVQVGVQHVTCMGDVALFVALAAAIDLSMDACQLFSQRLRKELCQDQEDYAL